MSNLSVPVFSYGNRAKRFIDNAEELQDLSFEDSRRYIEEISAELEYRETISKLNKRSYKYRRFDPNELGAIKWFAYPISFVSFGEEKFGDLCEETKGPTIKGYMRQIINGLVVIRTIELVIKVLPIKLIDFLPIGKLKGK